MANICNNKFFIASSNRKDFNDVVYGIKNLIESKDSYLYDGDIESIDESEDEVYDGYAEGWFTSKWVFPLEDFKKLIGNKDIYFRCLSEEYGCEYVAMNIYDGKWRDEQTFDL